MAAIPPMTAIVPISQLAPVSPPGITTTAAMPQTSFADLLLNGVSSTNAKLIAAERLATAFATDDTIPVHQVTYALEQARQSLELMMQVRGRLLDAYQQFMGMQL